MQSIKPIETVYRGYRFRSRLEARWAVLFDTLRVQWEYEKEGFELEGGVRYLPDFWLPELKMWVEVKGETCSEEDWCKVVQLRAASGNPVALVEGLPEDGDNSYADWDGHLYAVEEGRANVAVTFTNASLGFRMECPLCGDTYVHFAGEATFTPSDDYTAWAGRGSAARIPMYCEAESDRWTCVFGFHKGEMYCKITEAQRVERDFVLVLAKFNRALRNAAITKARQARFEHGARG